MWGDIKVEYGVYGVYMKPIGTKVIDEGLGVREFGPISHMDNVERNRLLKCI